MKLIRHSFERAIVIANVVASIPELRFALRHVYYVSSFVCFRGRN